MAAERQLDQLAAVLQLLADAADVVVADVVHLLLVLALDRLALAVDHRVGRDDAVVLGVGLDHLELDRAHPAADEEEVVLAHRAVGLEEVRLEEDVEEVARHALDRVVDRQDVHPLAVLDVRALVHRDHVAERHLEGSCAHLFIRILPASHVSSARTMQTVSFRRFLDQHRVAAEELELLHRREVERDDRVVVVRRLVDHQAVGVLLLLRLDVLGGRRGGGGVGHDCGCFGAESARVAELQRVSRRGMAREAGAAHAQGWGVAFAVGACGRGPTRPPTRQPARSNARGEWRWRRSATAAFAFGFGFQIAATDADATNNATANHSERVMKLNVKCSNGKTLNLEFDGAKTVLELKEAIAAEDGNPPAAQQRLIYSEGAQGPGDARLVRGAGGPHDPHGARRRARPRRRRRRRPHPPAARRRP